MLSLIGRFARQQTAHKVGVVQHEQAWHIEDQGFTTITILGLYLLQCLAVSPEATTDVSRQSRDRGMIKSLSTCGFTPEEGIRQTEYAFFIRNVP